MKRTSTDALLTLGMALYADKRVMERRIRGIFGRRRTAGPAGIAAALVCLMLGFTCFTTACVPERADAESAAPAESAAEAPLETAVPRPEATPEPGRAAVQRLVAGLAEASFTPITGPDRIERAAEEIAPGVTLAFNAAVTVPDVTGYGVRETKNRLLTDEEYLAIMEYFVPGADWRAKESRAGLTEGMAFDIEKAAEGEFFYLTAERGGEAYAFTGMRGKNAASFQRAGGIVYREGFLMGDWEMEADYGEIIREPIQLTREAARAKADKVMTDLGITGLALQREDRACMFAQGNRVLSRGWDFVYTQDDNGLLVPYRGGWGGGENDPLAYASPENEWVWIYVDETGVSRFYWNNAYTPGETLFQNVAVIGPEEAADLTRERLTRRYAGVTAEEAYIEPIEVTDIRLCAAQIFHIPLGEEAISGGLLVPAWEVACIARHGGMDATGFDVEYFYLVFNAIDGGALLERAN